jgi:diguanylate cyclase (GGDEF)-like protein
MASQAVESRTAAVIPRARRHRRRSELSRARSRTLFFSVLVVALLAAGSRGGALVAGLALLTSLYSVSVARRRGATLAHTFVVVDWLFLGLCLASSGGVDSWLLLAVPFLVLAELLPGRTSEWPFLAAPSLLLAIVLAIVDPSLGGDKAAGVVKIAALVTLGVVAAAALRRDRRRRVQPLPAIDPATGFYSRRRLHTLIALRMQEALDEHEPLGIVCLRLDHFHDSTDFYGKAGAEEIARVLARRVSRLLAPVDLAFRPAPDAFVLALPGRSAGETREFAAFVGHEVSARLVGQHRQTVSAGTSSFPATRSLEALLAEAFTESTREQSAESPEPGHAAAAERLARHAPSAGVPDAAGRAVALA